jgi:hypothetical protein
VAKIFTESNEKRTFTFGKSNRGSKRELLDICMKNRIENRVFAGFRRTQGVKKRARATKFAFGKRIKRELLDVCIGKAV